MATPVEIERKVRQLDNDVQSIYEMLAEIAATQRRQGNRLTEIDDRLTAIDDRLTAMDDRLTGMDDRFTGMDDRLTGVDDRLTGMDSKLDTILGLLQGGRPG